MSPHLSPHLRPSDAEVLSAHGLRRHLRRVVVVSSVVSGLALAAWVVATVVRGSTDVPGVAPGAGAALFLGGMAGTLSVVRTSWVGVRAPVAAAEGRGRSFRPLRRAVLRNDVSALDSTERALAVRWARTSRAAGRLGLQGSAPALIGMTALQAATLTQSAEPPLRTAVAVLGVVLFPVIVGAQVVGLGRLQRFLDHADAGTDPW